MSERAPSFVLSDYMEEHGRAVDIALESAMGALEVETDARLAQVARHGVMGEGKRLRPLLCVAAFEAVGGRLDRSAYQLAAALEMIHAYSLMHDDLPCMDDAELRRGRATTHIAYGEALTIRAGAALIPAAALQALRACEALGCDAERTRRVVRTLMEASGAGGMVGGQWLDLRGEGRALDGPALDDLHSRKTGAILTAASTIGGIGAGASEAAERALAEYGRAVGLAFQIADDILDATASAETLGKNPSDAAMDKSTYVVRYGLEDAGRRASAQMERARSALRSAAIGTPALEALAQYVVERRK